MAAEIYKSYQQPNGTKHADQPGNARFDSLMREAEAVAKQFGIPETLVIVNYPEGRRKVDPNDPNRAGLFKSSPVSVGEIYVKPDNSGSQASSR